MSLTPFMLVVSLSSMAVPVSPGLLDDIVKPFKSRVTPFVLMSIASPALTARLVVR